MQFSPFKYQRESTPGQMPRYELQTIYRDPGLVLLVIGVKVRRRMAPIVHADHNAEERADCRHRIAAFSDIEQEARGVLDALLDPHQEGDRFAAVDDAVIVG